MPRGTNGVSAGSQPASLPASAPVAATTGGSVATQPVVGPKWPIWLDLPNEIAQLVMDQRQVTNRLFSRRVRAEVGLSLVPQVRYDGRNWWPGAELVFYATWSVARATRIGAMVATGVDRLTPGDGTTAIRVFGGPRLEHDIIPPLTIYVGTGAGVLDAFGNQTPGGRLNFRADAGALHHINPDDDSSLALTAGLVVIAGLDGKFQFVPGLGLGWAFRQW